MSAMGGKWMHAARNIAELKVKCSSDWFSFAEADAGWVGTPTSGKTSLQIFRYFYSKYVSPKNFWKLRVF
jgi:hypothetical protein